MRLIQKSKKLFDVLEYDSEFDGKIVVEIYTFVFIETVQISYIDSDGLFFVLKPYRTISEHRRLDLFAEFILEADL